jgi:hypothetical protein
MLGYWAMPSAPPSDRRRGWMHTGDSRDDRRRGLRAHRRPHQGHGDPRGENIYPVGVENFLLEHRRSPTRRCSGIPDALYGEKLCAWIRCANRSSRETVIAWCKDRIAHYKIPALVRVVDAFPMTVTENPEVRDARAGVPNGVGKALSRGARFVSWSGGCARPGEPHWNRIAREKPSHSAWRLTRLTQGSARRQIKQTIFLQPPSSAISADSPFVPSRQGAQPHAQPRPRPRATSVRRSRVRPVPRKLRHDGWTPSGRSVAQGG